MGETLLVSKGLSFFFDLEILVRFNHAANKVTSEQAPPFGPGTPTRTIEIDATSTSRRADSASSHDGGLRGFGWVAWSWVMLVFQIWVVL